MIGFDLWLQQRSFGIGRPVIEERPSCGCWWRNQNVAVMHSRQSKAGVCDKHEEHDNYAAIVLQRNTYSYCIYCTYCQVSQQVSMETMGSQISNDWLRSTALREVAVLKDQPFVGGFATTGPWHVPNQIRSPNQDQLYPHDMIPAVGVR